MSDPRQLVKIDYDDSKLVEALRNTIAKKLNDEEFFLFLQFCKGTQLNAFKREIWAIKTEGYVNKYGKWVDGQLQIMTGINGFYAIANANPNYDGLQSGLIDPEGREVPLTYPKNNFIGAWARVFVKDRSIPTYSVTMLSEYAKPNQKGTNNWSTMPRTMNVKCAEAQGLRKALPQHLNGLYIPEEMGPDYEPEADLEPQVVNQKTTAPTKKPDVVINNSQQQVKKEAQNTQPKTVLLPQQPQGTFIYRFKDLPTVEDKLLARKLLKKAGGVATEDGKILTQVPVEELARFRVVPVEEAEETEPEETEAFDDDGEDIPMTLNRA